MKTKETRHLDYLDEQAEREAAALRRQGRNFNPGNKRIRQETDYNRQEFDKLFR